MPLYDYYCEICKREFDEYMPYTQRNDVFCCGVRTIKMIGQVNTHKDKAYEFTTEMFNGKPIEVRSKDHYQRLLKKFDIVDASRKEVKQHAKFRRRIVEQTIQDSYKKRGEEFAKKVYKDGIMKESKEILTKILKPRKEVKNGKRPSNASSK